MPAAGRSSDVCPDGARQLTANLQRSLFKVRAAAPAAKIIVTNYYDPYLAL